VTVSARVALALAMLLPLAGGCSLAGRSLGGYVDDHVVKHAVKRRLNVDHAGLAGAVKIDTFGGTVYLSGAVDTAREKSDAEIAAWQVEGVQQVVNDLVVQQAQAAPSALPRFHPDVLSRRIPGIKRVDPGPSGGPGLAYDGNGRVVASVYTIGWKDLIDSGLTTLRPTGRPIDHVSLYALVERPDFPGVHYAVVLWHVSEREAAALR
jgi:hypothetical protein